MKILVPIEDGPSVQQGPPVSGSLKILTLQSSKLEISHPNIHDIFFAAFVAENRSSTLRVKLEPTRELDIVRGRKALKAHVERRAKVIIKKCEGNLCVNRSKCEVKARMDYLKCEAIWQSCRNLFGCEINSQSYVGL